MDRKRFTDEQIEMANGVNILRLAESVGYELKRVTNDSYKIEGYGGLYVKGDGTEWNCFSHKAGGAAIQFIMFMENKTWVEAVKQLLNIDYDYGNNDSNCSAHSQSNSYICNYSRPEPSISKKFILPEKNNTYNHIIAYLVQTRKIDKDVVYEFIKTNKLYENKHRSCVFVGFDNHNNPQYAFVRSTNTIGTPFKQDVAGSDKSYCFSKKGSNDKVCVFESAIDLMSYLTLLKVHNIAVFNNHLISLGGVSDKALERYLKEISNIKQLVLCLDNDEAGHFSCSEIQKKYGNDYEIKRHLPKSKDFNQDLVSLFQKSAIFYPEKEAEYELE